jgi:hypothetical protein
MQPDDATGVFPVGNDTLSQDYIDRASVASLSTFYNLDLGQNVTISASPKGNVTLPEQLTPQLNLAFSNSTIKNGPLNYSYQYSYDEYGRTVTGDNATEATVTLTPLTPGTHHYQVYIEQNYIIHVWELPN